jgi:Ca2+-binding EF-hand superfamily protein
MVSSVSSSSSSYLYQTSSSTTSTKITEEQKKKLQEVLDKYDADSMTEEDTKSMMDEISELGIKPSKEFGEIMNTAGFTPPEKPGQGSGSVSSSSSSDSSSAVSLASLTNSTNDLVSEFSTALLNALNNNNSSDEDSYDLSSLAEKLSDSGLSEGALVDKKV